MNVYIFVWEFAQKPCWYVEVIGKLMCMFEVGSFLLLSTVIDAAG